MTHDADVLQFSPKLNNSSYFKLDIKLLLIETIMVSKPLLLSNYRVNKNVLTIRGTV